MHAVCWNGKHDVRVENVSDPEILNPHDAIVRVTLTAIYGSDLHLYDGYIPSMKSGDILGHESMGEIVEVGSANKNLKKWDRVVVPFNIACGNCFFCTGKMWSCCDNSNPNAWMAEAADGHSPAWLFGYSTTSAAMRAARPNTCGFPFVDTGPLKIPAGLKVEEVLFHSDIFPTGYQAAENCDVQEGDIVVLMNLTGMALAGEVETLRIMIDGRNLFRAKHQCASYWKLSHRSTAPYGCLDVLKKKRFTHRSLSPTAIRSPTLPEAYKNFRYHQNECRKVVLSP